MRYGLVGVGAILLLFVLVFAGWGWRYYTASIKGKVEAVEIIESGTNRIAQYEHFFNLCAAVQSLEAGISASMDEFELTSSANTRDRARILSNITGKKSQRLRSINQYNVDARKTYTNAQFRDSNLPYQLPTSEYQKGVVTSCGY